MFGYQGKFDNRTKCVRILKYLDNRTKMCSVIENNLITEQIRLSRYIFGYRKCIFGITITERSVIEVLLYFFRGSVHTSSISTDDSKGK